MNVVFISNNFPPERTPRAVQVSRLARHLGRPVRVICDCVRGEADPSILEDSEPGFTTRVCRPSFLSLLERIVIKCHGGGLFVPDSSVSWALCASKWLLKHVTFHLNDMLVTFGVPMSDHLAGLRIKRQTGMKWIAHFSDPWADNPFRKDGPLARRMNLRMESKVVENADRLVFTSQETVELVMRKYPAIWRDKVRVLPHAFDPTLYPGNARHGNAPGIVFRHVGNFYGHRTPEPLFLGLRMLLERDPGVLKEVSFELIGSVPDEMLRSDSFKRLPAGLVNVLPPVRYRKSLELMCEAAALLVIDAPADLSVFLPSKLVDYAGAGRPLFGIVPPGTSDKLIRELGGVSVRPENPASIADELARMLRMLRKAGNGVVRQSVSRERYSIASVADEFGAILDGLQ